MKNSFVLFLSVMMSLGYAQSNNQIKAVEFSTSSRGFSKQLLFTKTSLKIVEEDHRAASEIKPIIIAIKKSDWNKLVAGLNNIVLNELAELKSPTMDRAFDGARTSTITITTRKGKTYSHSFDNEKPNEKLQPLMKTILEFTP